ncbi:MAG: hypothetical protein RDV48_05135 [Candidatus Eremiobacteraeota bacterium]|nr:hypothetical protein [Candidatus Eremiobacteraeota bacterium]
MKEKLCDLVKEIVLSKATFELRDKAPAKGMDAVIKIESLAINNPHFLGFVIDNLSLVLQDFTPGAREPQERSFSRVAVESLAITIPQQWVNDEIEKQEQSLAEKDLTDMAISFLPGKIVVRGAVKKGASFPFSVEIKTGVQENKLMAKLAQFNLMEILPLPAFIQNFLIDLFKEKIRSRFVDIKNHLFLIDVVSAIPFPLDIAIKSFRVEKDYLILEA